MKKYWRLVAICLIPCLSEARELGTTIISPGEVLARVFSIEFSDPLQQTGGSGNAFDRELLEIGVNSFSAFPINWAQSTIRPASVMEHVLYNTNASVAVASVEANIPPNQTIRLTAAEPGWTELNAHLLSNPTKAIVANPLGVYAFPSVYRTVALHFVSDTAGGGHNPGLSAADAAAIMTRVNSIWSQVNVSFSEGTPADNVQVDFLTAPLPLSPNTYREQIYSAFSSGADYNIFLVNNMIQGSATDINGITYRILAATCSGVENRFGNFIFVRTHDAGGSALSLTAVANVVAHELGHGMGLYSGNAFRGDNLQADGPYPYMLLYANAIVGTTVTPLQRDCIESVY